MVKLSIAIFIILWILLAPACGQCWYPDYTKGYEDGHRAATGSYYAPLARDYTPSYGSRSEEEDYQQGYDRGYANGLKQEIRDMIQDELYYYNWSR